MQRRGFLRATGAGIATLGLGSVRDRDDPATDGFAPVDAPVRDRLTAVATTGVGPVAVGADGAILHRDTHGWAVVQADGLAGEGNALTAAAATSDGTVWLCGAAGTVGFYDPESDRLRDHSRPHGTTRDWTDVTVTGRKFDATVGLVDASGNAVVGTFDPDDGASWADPRQPTGSALTAIVRCGYERFRVADADGRVAESADGGERWTTLDAPAAAGFSDIDGEHRGVASVAGSGIVADYDHWAAAGERWTAHEVDGTIHAVERDWDDGLAVGTGGRLLERADGSWQRRATDADTTLRGVALGPEGVPDVVVGDGGTVLERGSYTARPYEVDLQYTGDGPLRYRLTVEGQATAGWDAEASDRVDSAGATTTIEGVTGGEGDGIGDSFAYAGELADLTVLDGEGDYLWLSARDESHVVPAQFAPQEWTAPATPTGATLRAVTDSAAGPVVVGDGGRVIARREGSWETVTASGPSGEGTTLRAAAATNEGEQVWFAGDGGRLGSYDPETGEVTDHSGSFESTDSVTALLAGGSPGDAVVLLATDAGQFFHGRVEAGSLVRLRVTTPASGASISGMTVVATTPTASGWTICDTNGDVSISRDWGETWETTSVPGLDGTPRAIGTRDPDEPVVACDDGSVVTYNGRAWTTRTLSDHPRHAVAGTRERTLVAGAGDVQSDRLSGWETVFDGGATIRDAVAPSGGNELAVAVGADGAVYEQRLAGEP